ncbi:MAG: hypothetical protein RL375_693 [Pseudomonadota bacterium]
MPALDPLHGAAVPATPLSPVQPAQAGSHAGTSTGQPAPRVEQRRERRRMLGKAPNGDLVLYPLAALARSSAGLDPAEARSAGTGIKVTALRDVSSSGLSVYVGQSLAPGQALAIELRSNSMQLDFSGLVVWSARADSLDGDRGQPPAEHVLGLELHGQQLLATMLGI